jgi:SAM-dependent methyltransferase
MEKKQEWFANESFWAQYAPVLFDAQRWAEAPTVAERVLRIIGAREGEPASGPTILDAGCGPGRIAVELASRGARVTGVDLIRPFLNRPRFRRARGRRARTRPGGPARVQAAGGIRRRRQPLHQLWVLRHHRGGHADTAEPRRVAEAGGWLVLEMTGREIAVRDFTEGEWFERGGFTVLTEFSVEGAWEGLRSRWILIDSDGRKVDHVFVQRLYSAVELKRLMIASGFSSVETYGDFDFSPYNEKARTMVLVARK